MRDSVAKMKIRDFDKAIILFLSDGGNKEIRAAFLIGKLKASPIYSYIRITILASYGLLVLRKDGRENFIYLTAKGLEYSRVLDSERALLNKMRKGEKK